MGAFKGGLTIKRYRVNGELPDGWRDAYVRALNAYRFQPVKPEDEGDRSSGWAVAGRLLDTDFDGAKVFWNDYVVLTFRTDSLRLPPTLLEAHVQVREEEEVARRGTDNLSRQERTELKELVRRELRRKMLPAIKATDVAWNLETGRVFVWTHNAGTLEEIEERFARTFDKVMLPEDPFSTADYAGFGEAPGQPLATVDPADFTGEGG